jgi:hypothetical protein
LKIKLLIYNILRFKPPPAAPPFKGEVFTDALRAEPLARCIAANLSNSEQNQTNHSFDYETRDT